LKSSGSADPIFWGLDFSVKGLYDFGIWDFLLDIWLGDTSSRKNGADKRVRTGMTTGTSTKQTRKKSNSGVRVAVIMQTITTKENGVRNE
jgi:hypothetical protein